MSRFSKPRIDQARSKSEKLAEKTRNRSGWPATWRSQSR